MTSIRWDTDDFRENQDSAGTTIYNQELKKGYLKGGLTPVQRGLVGWWPLHDGSASDLSGNGNHGTVNGATQGVTGILGETAYSFDGSDDYVNIPSPPSFNSYTISVWVYPHSPTAGEQDFVTLYDNNEVSLVLDHADDPQKWKLQQNYSGTWYNVASLDTVAASTWYHVAGVWNGSEIELFVNGVSQAKASVSGMDAYNGVSEIGARSASNLEFDGKLSDVRIYDHALTFQEIQYLYSVVKRGRTLTGKRRS